MPRPTVDFLLPRTELPPPCAADHYHKDIFILDPVRQVGRTLFCAEGHPLQPRGRYNDVEIMYARLCFMLLHLCAFV